MYLTHSTPSTSIFFFKAVVPERQTRVLSFLNSEIAIKVRFTKIAIPRPILVRLTQSNYLWIALDVTYSNLIGISSRITLRMLFWQVKLEEI